MVAGWRFCSVPYQASGFEPMTPRGGPGHQEESDSFDVPPVETINEAKAAFSEPRRRLATLVFDSLIDSDAVPEDHRLRFEHDGLSLDLDVAALPEGTGICGHVEPTAARVVLHIRGTDMAMVSDVDDARFAFRPVPHTLVRLSIEGSGPDIWTDWFRV